MQTYRTDKYGVAHTITVVCNEPEEQTVSITVSSLKDLFDAIDDMQVANSLRPPSNDQWDIQRFTNARQCMEYATDEVKRQMIGKENR